MRTLIFYLVSIGIRKLLLLGFSFAILSMLLVNFVAWKSFNSISSNISAVTEKTVAVNTEMKGLSENMLKASNDTKAVAGMVELKLMPAITANRDDMTALEMMFQDIADNISSLSTKKGLGVEDYKAELDGIMDMVSNVTLPVVQGVKENTADSAGRMEKMTLSLKELDRKLGDSSERAQNATASTGSIMKELKNAQQSAIGTRNVMLISAGAITVLILLVSFLISVSISRPLTRVTEHLGESSQFIYSASSQISDSSQSLAQGSTDQATALNESSESVKAITVMAEQNAKNADSANTITKEALKNVKAGVESMQGVVDSMDSIKEASGEISKIIKVIEEIAFQTNLLALNAAVEAARAGEHGKGFAVVAEEVRNLAQRSANAAKETEELIRNSVNKSEAGAKIVGISSKALNSINESVKTLAEIVVTIASDSNSQAKLINEIDSSISQIDEVTQRNASNSAESASASEELRAQSEYLRLIVDALSGIIQGGKSDEIDRVLGSDNLKANSRLLSDGTG